MSETEKTPWREQVKPSRRKNEPEYWGAWEVAEHLGVRQTNLRTLAGLPQPYQHLRMGTIWRASDIRRFGEARSDRAKEKAAA